MGTWLVVGLILVVVMVALFRRRLTSWLQNRGFESINRSITGAEEYEP